MEHQQQYYFSNSSLQLDLNLTAVSNSLLELLDSASSAECFTCSQLRCCCAELLNDVDNDVGSQADSDNTTTSRPSSVMSGFSEHSLMASSSGVSSGSPDYVIDEPLQQVDIEIFKEVDLTKKPQCSVI